MICVDQGFFRENILMRYAQRREKIKKCKEQEGKRVKGN